MLLILTRLGPLLGVKGFMAPRLQAVPFWIVERSSEIAEREKTGANERGGGGGGEGEGTWGEAGKRSLPSHFSFISPRSSLAAL